MFICNLYYEKDIPEVFNILISNNRFNSIEIIDNNIKYKLQKYYNNIEK